jgi:hypothetical protein
LITDIMWGIEILIGRVLYFGAIPAIIYALYLLQKISKK